MTSWLALVFHSQASAGEVMPHLCGSFWMKNKRKQTSEKGIEESVHHKRHVHSWQLSTDWKRGINLEGILSCFFYLEIFKDPWGVTDHTNSIRNSWKSWGKEEKALTCSGGWWSELYYLSLLCFQCERYIEYIIFQFHLIE